MSDRPSVRLSVRPCVFSGLFFRFGILIWNLVCTFSRWHDMSSLSFITMMSLWPTLQPKVGQTHFFFNHGLKNQVKSFKFGTMVARYILPDISSVFFFQNSYLWNFGDYFCVFWIFRSFSGFFLHVLRYRFETWYIHCRRRHRSSSSFITIGTLWPTLQQKIGQSHFFCIHGLKKYIELSQILYTHLYSECLEL